MELRIELAKAGVRDLISPEEIGRQYVFMDELRSINAERAAEGRKPLAFTETFGCQQNESDTERIRGMLSEMGYGFTDDADEADIVIVNTCAIREHAENKALSGVGEFTHTKKKNPDQYVVLCGCLASQPGIADKIKRTYRQVDLSFGPNMLWRFPELLHTLVKSPGRYIYASQEEAPVAEDLPIKRDNRHKAWVSIMYGCDNFCSYCIVPYVRGRERSRDPEKIEAEVRGLVEDGCKEITLLGQNVNSYGKGLPEDINFPALLRRLSNIEGDFLLRFMTSHPKDATEDLFAAMAESLRIAKVIHLPFQSGSDRVLKAMNRGYTGESYMRLIEAARRHMPDITITSDVIVGFPGETDEDFEETLKLCERVEFDALFTFIYSKRPGTRAAEMDDPMPMEQKKRNFDRLLKLQDEISRRKHEQQVGKTLRALVEGPSKMPGYNLAARTNGNRLCYINADPALLGSFVDIKVTGSAGWTLSGEVIG